MQAKARSRTAEGVALARAVAVHEKDEWIRGPDHLAVHLLGLRGRLIATVPALRRLARAAYDRILPGVYMYHCARTRHFDDLFAERIAAGVRQFVILGAGLDTRAYRFADRLRDARVFEVDHPLTAAWKQQRLHRALPSIPGNVAYVGVDFETDSLSKRLAIAGLDAGQPTFFLWEGVMMYLTAAAVDATLAFVAAAAPGSTLAFEYLYSQARELPDRYFGAEKMIHYVAARGEPFRFGIDPDHMDSFLAAHGMRAHSHRRAEDFDRAQREHPQWKPAHRMIDCWGAVHAGLAASPPPACPH